MPRGPVGTPGPPEFAALVITQSSVCRNSRQSAVPGNRRASAQRPCLASVGGGVILARPCILHQCLSMQNEQGGIKMTWPPSHSCLVPTTEST